jgi:hypothetical protein
MAANLTGMNSRNVFGGMITAISAAAIIAMAAGCGRTDDAGISTPSHEVDRPTRGTQNWMWSEVSDSNYHSVITPLVGLDNTRYLNSTHELTAWVQGWVDRIDGKIRSEHPQQMANTPKPIAKVIKNGSANAFVAPVPVCYDVKVKIKGGTPNAANTADAVYLDAKAGEFSSWPAQYKCVGGEDDLAEVKSFVSTFNAASTGCKFSVSTAGVLEGNNECVRADDLGDTVAAKQVVLLQTANYVTVHTGIFPLMSEEALIGVIAHELGHYYRAHVTGAASDFDFFYTLGRNNVTVRPVPEADKKEMGDKAVAASTLLNATDTYTAITGQKIRPELFMAVGSVVSAVADLTGAPAACKTANELIDSDDFVKAMGTYPFAEANADMTDSYQDFETKVEACLKALKMSSGDTLTGTGIGYRKFLSHIESPVWPTWLGRISDSGRRYVAKMNGLALSRAGQTAPNGQTLADVTAALSKKMKSQDDAGEQALKVAHSSQLGQYTSEQEADEVAAEWVNDIGIAPTHMVDAMRRLGKGSTTSLRGFILGESDCEDLWKRDWMDANGSYFFVPIGDYSEVHHSTCYRMFNLDREIAAHDYETPSVNPPLLSSAAWLDLQRKAAGLAESADSEESTGGHDMAPIMKKALETCTYAQSFL